jgi:hypothetical protein
MGLVVPVGGSGGSFVGQAVVQCGVRGFSVGHGACMCLHCDGEAGCSRGGLVGGGVSFVGRHVFQCLVVRALGRVGVQQTQELNSVGDGAFPLVHRRVVWARLFISGVWSGAPVGLDRPVHEGCGCGDLVLQVGDSDVWLWVLSDSSWYMITLRITGLFFCQRGRESGCQTKKM